MPWTSLSGRLPLPLILCGPIVRRVQNDSVSIWIALKEAATVELSVFPTESSTTPDLQASAPTRQLGEHLHVAVVTAKAANDASRLDDGRIYYYDLDFGSGRTLNASNVLSTSGSGLDKIVYDGETRPSFVSPPSEVDNLVLAQASCRNAHGGETDAMVALDLVLASQINQQSNRPQQLFLTGDQIYSDDVAYVVLHQAIDAAETLLGWSNPEPLPGTPNEDKLRVGSRDELLKDDEDFTGATVCHLVRLGEFYAMYLMAWSLELWDADLPTFATVAPHKPAKVPQAALFGSSGTTVMSDDLHTYRKQYKKLKRFVEKLPATRRLLANIATYMIFDDHEVTDDWFLDAVWTEDNVKDGEVTKRVVQNGLAAYAVFQAWGNTPDDYTTGNRAQLLTKLETLHANQGTTQSDWTDIFDLIVPKVVESSGGDVVRTLPKIRFDYKIDFPAHSLLVLDTRTARGFPKRDFFLLHWIKALFQLLFGGIWIPGAALISEQDFDQQLPDPPAQRTDAAGMPVPTLILSAAPVFGHWVVEEILQPKIAAFGIVTLNLIVDRYTVDYEAWSLNRHAFQELLRRLSKYSPAVVLAGDVHYSLSTVMQYWDDRAASTDKGIVAQLCCSSVKNSDSKTNLIDGRLLNPRTTAEYFGWNTSGDHIHVDDNGSTSLRHVSAAPDVHQLRFGESLADPDSPDWRYRLKFVSDERTTGRGIPTATTTGHPRNQLAAQHKARSSGSKRKVVGRDNASIIDFTWTVARKAISHEIWYAFDPDDDPHLLRPYTVHTLELDEPTDSERPGGP